MTRDFLILNDTVSPAEGVTWTGASEGVVIDLWIDAAPSAFKAAAELAEVRWNDGTVGTWPTDQLELVREATEPPK